MLQYHLRILSVGSRLRDGGAVSAKRGGEPALSGVSSPHPDPHAAVGAPVQYARPTVTADRNSRVVRWQGRSVAQTGLRQQHCACSDDGIHRLHRLPGVKWLAVVPIGARNRVSRLVGGSCALVRSEPTSGFSRVCATSAGQNGPPGGGRAAAQEPEAWRPNLDTALLATAHFRRWRAIGRGRPRVSAKLRTLTSSGTRGA